MKKVAISACLLGNRCHYDGEGNFDGALLEKLKGDELVAFCPEDFVFGTPRPTMDLIETEQGIKALSNLTGADLSPPVEAYADAFFDTYPDIDLFIGKDRSPSCGVRSARLYDRDKNLLSEEATGLMAAKAVEAGIEAWDAEVFWKRATKRDKGLGLQSHYAAEAASPDTHLLADGNNMC